MGVCFYLGTTVAGAMYILGTVEMLTMSFPEAFIICAMDGRTGDELPYMTMRIYGLGILVACSLTINGGMRYISKISPYFLFFVLSSILCILIGIFIADSGRKYVISPDNSCLAPNETAMGDFDLPGGPLKAASTHPLLGLPSGGSRCPWPSCCLPCCRPQASQASAATR